MEDPDDTLFPEEPETPDWRHDGKGVWTVTLLNGDKGTIIYSDELDTWKAEVLRGGETKTRSFKDFNKGVAWANKTLFPPKTAWDFILSV